MVFLGGGWQGGEDFPLPTAIYIGHWHQEQCLMVEMPEPKLARKFICPCLLSKASKQKEL